MNRKIFGILVATMLISAMGISILVPLLPVYASNLGATGLELGIVFAGFGISHAIFLPIVGKFSDRFGRKVFLCTSLSCLVPISLSYIWAQSALHLIIIRCLQGIATTMHLPVAQAYLGDLTPAGEEGRWMGYFSAFLLASLGLGPLFGGLMADLLGMSAAFMAMAALNLIGLIATIIWLPEVPRKTMTKKETLSIAELRRSDILKGTFTFRLAVGFSTGILLTFLPVLASQRLGLSMSLVGVLLACRTPISLMQTITGRLADRLNRRVLVAIGSIFGLIFMALLPTSASFWTLLVILSVSAAGITLAMPAATALVVEEGRTYGMGAAMAIFMMAMTIGQGVGPILLGGVVDVLGVEAAFYYGGTIPLIGIVLFVWFTRNYTRGRTTQTLAPTEENF
jgi:DHA1 family multidrug resistance protein-like MFS transporter